MDRARRSRIESLMTEKKFGEALMLLTDTITSMKIDQVSYSNDDFVWAHSQRSICFRQLGQLPYAYDDARKLIKRRPTLAVGYLRKAEIELEVGLTDQAVSTLSLWQHKRPGTGGDDDDGASEAIQQLKHAREKHRAAMNEKRKTERTATVFGWLCGVLLGSWLCSTWEFSWLVVVYILLGSVFGYLFTCGTTAMSRMQESQRRSTLVDVSDEFAPEDDR